MPRTLIVGCGYVGSALARRLVARGHDVWCLRRSVAQSPPGTMAVAADVNHTSSLDAAPRDLDFVVYAPSPDARTNGAYRTTYVDGLRNTLRWLRDTSPDLTRVVFVSSTAVYGQTHGEWVDEDSPTVPTHFTGVRLLEAEREAEGSGLPVTVVRLGGIYGPGRTRLVQRVRAGEARDLRRLDDFTNRIHRDDCAGVLEHVISGIRHRIVVAVDSEPILLREVVTWLAQRLGVDRTSVADIPSAPAGGKRCRSDLLIASGFEYAYPTFRDGYEAILGDGVTT